MKPVERKIGIVDLAWEVIDMQRRLDIQESELSRLILVEKKYHKLLNDGIAHGEKMVGGMLMLALNGSIGKQAATE